MSNAKHLTEATPVELLSVSAANSPDGGFLILSMRLDPSNMTVHNLCLSSSQAARLFRDLSNLLQYSDTMKKAMQTTPNLYDYYKAVVLETRHKELEIETSPEESE